MAERISGCELCGVSDLDCQANCTDRLCPSQRPWTPEERAEALGTRRRKPGRPRLLDPYCCQGGAAMGYHRAGFDIVGIDKEPQPNYPFEFVQMDALEYLDTFFWTWTDIAEEFDAIHASPPCQVYLNLGAVNRALGRDYAHADLIAGTRARLIDSRLPYVIENVADAKPQLRNPVRLCGTSFGLPLRRHRLFESNVPLTGTPCSHHLFTEKKYWTGWRPRGEHRLSTVVQVYGNAADKHAWPAAMGIDWMDDKGMAEAVPPAYTEHIGRHLIGALTLEQAA